MSHNQHDRKEPEINEHVLYVRKEDGSKEAFDQRKLYESLIKSGAEPHQAEKIVNQVIDQVRSGDSIFDSQSEHRSYITTASEIYHRAYDVLKGSARVIAARYSLRRSLLEFGPTGFPFEQYIAELFKAKWGYETLVGQIVLGGCVPHEVDVVAWNKEKLLMCEVKYHSDAASKTDLKVALYVSARYEDLKGTTFDYGDSKQNLKEGWLVTNTRLTDTAITYGECQGLKMISWDYPAVNNLQQLIENTQLHPITCLTTLSPADKRVLMDQNIVLVRTLFDKKPALQAIGFTEEQITELYDEASEILKTVPAN